MIEWGNDQNEIPYRHWLLQYDDDDDDNDIDVDDDNK